MSRMYINPSTFDVAQLTKNEVSEFPGFVPIVDYCQDQADALATLRADNAKLREALADLVAQFDDMGYPANKQAKVNASLATARRVLEETSHAAN